MKNRWMTITRRCLLTLAVISALAMPASAQNEKIRSIVKYTVNPGRSGDFEAAIRDYNALLAKAGWENRATWWQSLSGQREYSLVRYHANYAAFEVTQNPKLKDVRVELNRVTDRMRQCTESMERIIDEVDSGLSLPRSAEIPKMIRLLRIRVRPDRVDDYLAAMKADLLPAIKKSGLSSFTMARTRYGAPRNEFRSSASLNGWADLDGTSPIVKAMGEDAYRKYLAKTNPMITLVEYNIYRFAAELSYIPK